MECADAIRVAVITGGHPFDVPGFQALFEGPDDIEAYPQEFSNWVHDWGNVRREYEVNLFYNMHMDPLDGPYREAVEELRRRRKGIFVLHHALLSWPELEAWNDIVGIQDRSFGYDVEQEVHVDIAEPSHPIVQGLEPWDMPDETYTMADAGTDSRVLLTVEHPRSMTTIAWTRRSGDAPVFCLQSGHDARTWTNPSFREVVHRGIRWCAGRL